MNLSVYEYFTFYTSSFVLICLSCIIIKEYRIFKILYVAFIAVFIRGQRTLAWSWPDQTLFGQELTDRQSQLKTTGSPGQRTVFISECPGQKGQQYCKRLVLHNAQAKDTGYYRCYYKDIRAIDGTTAVRTYAFVKGEQD